MRQLKSSILILCLCIPVFGQEETLVGTGEIDHGGYGALVVKVTGINGETAILVGGRGGWIINHTFVLGGGGYGLVNNLRPDDPGSFLFPDGETLLNFGYGGLELAYIINSDKLIHSGRIKSRAGISTASA